MRVDLIYCDGNIKIRSNMTKGEKEYNELVSIKKSKDLPSGKSNINIREIEKRASKVKKILEKEHGQILRQD